MARPKSRSKFNFRICYFNPDATFYFSTTEEWEVPVDSMGEPIMHHVLAKLRGLRDSGGQMGMPGDVDEGWPGPIVLESRESFAQSVLLMPKTTDLEQTMGLLDHLKIDYEIEDREQRVVVSRLPEREGLAKKILTIGPGVGVGLEASTTFYFDGAGKFLSYATWEDS